MPFESLGRSPAEPPITAHTLEVGINDEPVVDVEDINNAVLQDAIATLGLGELQHHGVGIVGEHIRDQMTEGVRVRGLLPQFVQESLGKEGAIRLLSGWLDEGDVVDEIQILDVASVPFKERVTLRYTAHSGDNPQRYLVEHHIFIQTDDDKVKKFDMVCSGWLQIDGASDH